MENLISRNALVTKLSQGYWDRELQQAKNDPCVIDAMIDWAIRIVKEMPHESPWHTGTPTETGWYILCLYNKGNWYHPHFYVADFYSEVDGKMYWSNDEDWSEYTIVAWQKIEPYKEANNGNSN